MRPSVIDGWQDPHTEDRIHRVRVGDAELGYAKLAIRCAVTLVDQATEALVGTVLSPRIQAVRRGRRRAFVPSG